MSASNLLRLPGVFYAAGDILTGYLLVRFGGAGIGSREALGLLLLSGAAVTIAGGLWERLFSAVDAAGPEETPELPGGLGTASVFFFAALLTAAALVLAMRASYPSFLAGSLLLGVILLRSAALRETEAARPLATGAGRALAIWLGMTAHPHALAFLGWPVLVTAPLLVGLFSAVRAELDCLARRPAREEFPPEGGEVPAALGPARGLLARARTEPDPSARLIHPLDMPVAGLGVAGLVLIPAAVLWVTPRFPLVWGALGALFLILAINGMLLLRDPSLLRLGLLGRAARRGTVLLEGALVAGLLGGRPGAAGLAGVLLITATALPAMMAARRAGEVLE